MGAKREKQKAKTWHKRFVAKTMIDLLKSRGEMTFQAVHEIVYPNQTDVSHGGNASRDINKPEIMHEFYKLLRMDDKAIARFGPADIITDILNDLHKINLMLESPEITNEDFQKLQNTKTQKQKMLGSYHGIWNAEREQDTKDSDPDKLWELGKQRFSLS